MFTLARDLNLVTSRILTGLTAILLAGHNFTRAWDVAHLDFARFSIISFSLRVPLALGIGKTPLPHLSACESPNAETSNCKDFLAMSGA